MTPQNDDMVEQANEIRKMIAATQKFSSRIAQQSDILIEATADVKANMKTTSNNVRKNLRAMDTMKRNQSDIAALAAAPQLAETKKTVKKKIIF